VVECYYVIIVDIACSNIYLETAVSETDSASAAPGRKPWIPAVIVLVSVMFLLLFLECSERVICSIRHRSLRYIIYPFFQDVSPSLPQARRARTVTVEKSTGSAQTESTGNAQTESSVEAEQDYYKLTPGEAGEGIRINSLGFRGKEFVPEKPGGVYRIFCTGGSSTFSSECGEGETYPARLETMLDKFETKHADIEVINAGFEGYDTAKIVSLIQNEINTYRPDLITVCEAFNDLEDTMFVINSFARRVYWQAHRLLYNRSLLYTNLLFWCGRRGMDTAVYAAKFTGRKERYSTNLRAICQSALKSGTRVVFVLQPFFHPEDSSIGYMRNFSLIHQDFLAEMKKVARDMNVPLVDPRRAFSSHRNPRELFIDSVHLTPAGSDLLARELYRVLTTTPGLL